ncbi:MAG: class I SAM-dependent DNA methyltransferase [Aeriscardovia sp.]|nr:class I SAM-dependent DNA methyltransferase [Aeriscardovia sp.]
MITQETKPEEIATFINQWKDFSSEDQGAKQFWTALLSDVLHVDGATDPNVVQFEYRTPAGGKIDMIDGDARFLLETKSRGKLDESGSRRTSLSEKTEVDAVQQARAYTRYLPPSLQPTIICTCDFHTFRFYDLESDPLCTQPTVTFTLEELADNIDFFRSIFSEGNSRIYHQEDVSQQAGVLVADIHNAFQEQYDAYQAKNPDCDPEKLHHDLAVLTVRFVFCLYAEDVEGNKLFPHNAFGQFLDKSSAVLRHMKSDLEDLFTVLNTKVENRDPDTYEDLMQFPYVNGGLFAENIIIPEFTPAIRDALLTASHTFDWSTISPVIFGSLMEETLSHEERRGGGMHYTTVQNIHRVIDPLFLNDLTQELETIENNPYTDIADGTFKEYKEYKSRKTPRPQLVEEQRIKDLKTYRDKLASLQFLDPACGSGNFLTESYISLRKLENRVLTRLLHGQGTLDFGGEYSLIKVSIDQFHGIEINDFAVSVAQTALWIAEQQALDDTESIADCSIPHLPLHNTHCIICENALQYDWNNLIPAANCDYVMGNPPFIGLDTRSTEQTNDLTTIWGTHYDGHLDYVTGWYKKASDYYQDNPHGVFAFVSTNSITQGNQPAVLFKPLFEEGWRISFAHRTFAWDSQSSDKAHVHVVIIGMDKKTDTLKPPVLYTYHSLTSEPTALVVKHINPYLLDAPDIWVKSRSQKAGLLSPELNIVHSGSAPVDGGALLLNTPDEYDIAMNDPIARQYVHPYRMGKELINGIDRWCLWMPEEKPLLAHASQFLTERIEACKASRLQSPAQSTRKLADTPWRFGSPHQPDEQYLAIPRVFTQNREYATCDYYTPDIIAGDKVYTCVDSTGFNFAIIESRMFMVWQKAVGGRMKSDPSFSNTIVWNNLPLPSLDSKPELRDQICDAGKKILTVRGTVLCELQDQMESLEDRSVREKVRKRMNLAFLYNPETMPETLRKAHQQLDELVDQAFSAEKYLKEDNTARLKLLFIDYQRLTSQK